MKKGKSKEYLGLVARLSCRVCGSCQTNVHHIKEGWYCMGKKSPDWHAIPLCHNHHQGKEGFHQIGAKTWRAKYGSEIEMAKRVQEKLASRIDIPEEFLIVIEEEPDETQKLKDALVKMVYETTHLSRCEEDGSHWCKISASTLKQARDAIVNTEPKEKTNDR